MSTPIFETLAVVAIVGLATAMIALPRPKPDPAAAEIPPVEYVDRTTVRSEPLPDKTDIERVQDVTKKLDNVDIEQRQLIEQIKQLTAEAKKK